MTTIKPDLTSSTYTKEIFDIIDGIKSDVAEVLKSGVLEDEKAANILIKAGRTIDELIGMTFSIEELYGER